MKNNGLIKRITNQNALDALDVFVKIAIIYLCIAIPLKLDKMLFEIDSVYDAITDTSNQTYSVKVKQRFPFEVEIIK